MVKFLYATTNAGKIENMKNRLRGTGFDFVSPTELDIVASVNETGKNEIENATIKAEAYVDKTNLPVLGADSGLYFEDTKFEDPGLKVKRQQGKTLSKEEQIEFYMDLARQNGGSLRAHFVTAFALIVEGKVYTGEVAEPTFLFLSERDIENKDAKMMDSIEFSLLQNKYFSQMSEQEFKKEDSVFRNYITKFLSYYLEQKQV